jgi:hypothetical protein
VGSALKITEVAISLEYFFHRKSDVIIVTKVELDAIENESVFFFDENALKANT